MRGGVAVLLAALAAQSALGQEGERTLILRGAEVRTSAGPAIPDGVVLIRGTTIQAVGTAGQVAIPDGAEIIDASGCVLTPGLIDGASFGFLQDQDYGIAGDVLHRVADGLDRLPEHLEDYWSRGVTGLFVVPPSSGNALGQPAFVRIGIREPLLAEAGLMFSVANPAALVSSPLDAETAFQVLRAQFEAAKQYAQTWVTYRTQRAEWEARPEAERGQAPNEPGRDPKQELIARTLAEQDRLRVFVRADTAAEIRAALRLKDEFSLDMVIVGGAEAASEAAALVEKQVSVLYGPAFVFGLRTAAFVNHRADAASIRQAGVAVAVGSLPLREAGHPVGSNASRFILDAAAAAGGTRDEILASVTLRTAEILRIDAQMGSIRPGRLADLVLWTGDPVDPGSRVRMTLVNGEVVWRAD